MDFMVQLEKAAIILMSPHATVSCDDRKQAEQIVLEFRKVTKPYSTCRFILENSKVDYVLFEATCAVKEAILREWTFLQKTEIDEMCSFLLRYVTHHKSLRNFVREQILQVVAIIIKRGSLDLSHDSKENLLTTIEHLIKLGDKEMLLICCSILKALLTEFSSTNKSANVGLSLEFHAQCKHDFEVKDLLKIFSFTTDILRQFVDVPISSLSPVDVAIFTRYLSLAEQILSWRFSHGNLTLLQTSNDTASVILFKPPSRWKQTLLNASLPELFFKVLATGLHQEELTHHSLQCLVQLASVSGPVLHDSESKIFYLTNFMIKGFLQFLGRSNWSALEALGCANIVSRLINVFPISDFAGLPDDCHKKFTDLLSERTIQFLELATSAENDNLDDKKYQEALDTVLDAWVILLSKAHLFQDGYFMLYSVNIFNAYLKAHLVAPEGLKVTPSREKEEDIDCDIEEDDRVTHSDELDNIGVLGRQALHQTLSVLTDLLSCRLSILGSYLHSLKLVQQGTEYHDIDTLFEDIHWLLLISTHLLMLHDSGETPTVPEEVVKYGAYQYGNGRVSIDASVHYLSSLGVGVSDEGVDKLIQLVALILYLAKMETAAIQSGLASVFSPEVASSTLWFLQRWVASYLLLDQGPPSARNEILAAAFSLNRDAGKQLVAFVLEICEVNFMKWCSEPRVAEDAVHLLLQLVKNKTRCSIALGYPNVWRVAHEFVNERANIHTMPPGVLKCLVQALVTAGLDEAEVDTREKFFSEFLAPLKGRYNRIRQRADFHKIAQNEMIKNEIITFLDSMRGMALATDSNNVNSVSDFMFPILEDSVILLKEYQDFNDLTEVILELFLDVVETQLTFLNKEKTDILLHQCLVLLQSYAKLNKGKKTVLPSEEEEQFSDLLLLIKILTQILSKDYIDLSDDAVSGGNKSTSIVADTVIFGLSIIIPMISIDLLQFPKLSTEYFQLVAFVCESYPEKIGSLTGNLYEAFVQTLEVALSTSLVYSPDIAKNTYEALRALGKYNFIELKAGRVNVILDNTVKRFLKIVLEGILMSSFDFDLIHAASDAFFALICCNRVEYFELARKLINEQKKEDLASRLQEAFLVLIPDSLILSPEKHSYMIFRKNLWDFLLKVKGFLCLK